MSLVIWKQVLKIIDVQEIEVPAGAQMLTARVQMGYICVWFRCIPTAPKTKRTIIMVGTGRDAPNYEDATYLGTALLYEDSLVLHVFEKI